MIGDRVLSDVQLSNGVSVKLLFRVIVLFSLIVLTACSQENPPADAPANVSAAAGENLVALTWDNVPGRTYWIYYKQGASVDLDSHDGILYNHPSPYLVQALSNGLEYAFAVTSSQSGSKVGPFSPVVTATPRQLSPTVAWTVGTSLTANNLLSVAYGAGIYVTVGDAASVFVANYSYTSPGGVTAWNPATSLPVTGSTNLSAVIYDGARFMALGTDGTVIKSSSTDVLTWVAASGITGATKMNDMAAGAGRYVAVGNAGEIYTNLGDAASAAWTLQSSGTGYDLYGISYLNGRFVAVGAFGTLLTSTDGVKWVSPASGIGDSLRKVAYGASTYVAVGDAGAITSSSDAITWTAQSVLPGGQSLHGISFGPDNQFIAVGTAGTLAYSATGADNSWLTANAGSVDLNSIAPNLVFIATGAAGANVSGK